MADKKPSKEQYAVFKKRAKDKSISAEAREKFQMLVDKFADDFKEAEKEVEKAVKGTSKKYKKLPKPSKKVLIKIDREGDESNRNKLKEMGYNPSEVDKLSMGDANTIVEDLEKSKKTTPKKRGRKPKAKQTEQSADDIAKAKAEIKKRTGKTEEQCESIIEEYKALRSKAQTRKKKETKAKEDNKKRVTQLKKEDKVIEGTNEKTAEATIEKVSENIGKKIEKEIEKVEKEVKKDETAKAKKEVDKKSPKKSATEKKKEVEKKVEAKVEKKVKEKTKVVVKKVIIDTSSMLKSIAESLGNFDKDSQKEFLMKLRSDIDKLLSKYMYGGDVSGATQQLDITQSNLSASSVNPSKFERGGGVDFNDWWEDNQEDAEEIYGEEAD